MAFADIAQRAARDQLRLLGAQLAYTTKGGDPVGDVWVQVIRDLMYERADREVSVAELMNVANMLVEEVPAPRRGDSFVEGAATWTVDAVLENNGYLVKVAIKDLA